MITVVAALIKTGLLKLGRAVFGEAAGDIPVDITELERLAEDALRPHGPPEPSMPLPYSDVERQRAQAARAARPETARPPPLPEPALPELAWAAPFPATFPVTDVTDLPDADRPFPKTLPAPALRAEPLPVRLSVPRPEPRSSRPPPPSPAMPRAASRPLVPRPLMQRAAKRLPTPPRKT